MMGYKDILLDMPDSEYEEAVGFLNDVLADDTEAIRQWQDDLTEHYFNQKRNLNNEYQ